jgi:hypothetical protein
MTRRHNIIQKAYEVLKKNEFYWTFDNDYKNKYRMIKDFVTTDSIYSDHSIDYLADIAEYMMNQSKVIFRH